MKIDDGTGCSYQAKVDSENRLTVLSTTKTVEHDANFSNGKAWSISVERTPTAVACCGSGYLFYFKNTGTKTYIFEGFDYRVASAENYCLFINNTGTVACGTAVTPVALNTGSSQVICATIQDGVSLAGLANGSSIGKVYFTSTETSQYNFDQDLVVTPGGVFAVKANTGGVATTLTFNVFETDI
jgi:hypothetical protein